MNLISYILFVAALFFYTLTAWFFVRLFVWKRYSEHYYWKKRPAVQWKDIYYLSLHKEKEVPFISLIVPARDEALVISKTIENLLQMDYPKDRFEIVIVTDEREELAILKQELITPENLTTASIARKWQCRFHHSSHQIKVLTVPCGFDGRYRGRLQAEAVPSTKGRALNYALQYLDSRSSVVGFYDAESRPDHKTLLFVAHEYLLKEEAMPVLQGPLFQVRNYYRLGPVSRLGGLFKAISHDWYLPVIFRSLPFVGGTHFFVCKSAIEAVRGFDLSALTEDLDFGIRVYQTTGKRVEFLPVISTEQTPPHFSQYFRQRLRWAAGHLQVMNALGRKNPLYWGLFFKGPFEWMLYQGAALTVLGMNLLFLLTKLDWISLPIVRLPISLEGFFGLVNVPYLVFSFYCFRRYAFTYDRDMQIGHMFPGFDLIRILISSLLVFLLPLPYTYAIWMHLFKKKPTSWIKTARTAE